MMPDEPLLLDLTPRPIRADAQKNHELLLRTAAALFSARGVEAVTMSDIAQAAGVGKGTLYRHFSHKTEVCHALLDYEQRQLQARTLARLRTNQPPLDDVHWFAEQVADFVMQNLAYLSVVDAAVPLMMEHPAHRWWWQTLRALMERSGVAGDLDYLTDALVLLLDPVTLRFQAEARGYSQQRIVDGLHTVIRRLTLA
ncbi:MAG: TetR/AcrR family transcriptional regulator [Armatimonadetes bacterium]|nr:TetR/AcrR family transcriptional regulator [Anaerolineae bacterium]